MKRIYRIEEQGKVAGICAGLGEMFNFDPTLIRLAMVFACVATGFFPLIVAYVVGWVIIPRKEDVEKTTVN